MAKSVLFRSSISYPTESIPYEESTKTLFQQQQTNQSLKPKGVLSVSLELRDLSDSHIFKEMLGALVLCILVLRAI